ncbi:tyrosine phosphatase family-domain-containing protein [Aspergillus bertholletiae]|uniref:Tyrosine phosphatase family-domain-containing protein n=1 Tax=Aspergillus bertholletiae TaxID=1226010 RepID=A0A5N7BJ65_9EURO|nr:tyrosine phosphatase family-domain-containing protein [Aspergillus bertholletiae]
MAQGNLQGNSFTPGCPWVEIEGTFNCRDFGGYQCGPNLSTRTRDRMLYRSGHLEGLTLSGLQKMRELSISTIIDLRNLGEAKALYSKDKPDNENLNGFKIIRFPLDQKGLSIQHCSAKYEKYLKIGSTAVAQEYFDMLLEGHQTIRDILLLLRDNPSDVFLIHCSLGKDRTGIIFAILFSLAGVAHEAIASEYSLSEAALESLLPDIAQVVKASAPPGLTSTEALRIARGVITTTKDAMMLTLEKLEETFGSTFRYVSECCGLCLEDINQIQQNLTLESK